MARKHVQINLLFNHTHRVVSLYEGERKEFYHAEDTDEGYSFEHVQIEYNGDEITEQWTSGGCDCDGPIKYYSDFVYLDRNITGTLSPNRKYQWPWMENDKHSQWDCYAEAAGY